MTCASCVVAIEKHVETVEIEVKTDPPERLAEKQGDSEQLRRCFLHIGGMTCASCVVAIEKHVGKVDGVNSVLVALMAAKAEVEYDPSIATPEKLSRIVTDLGFPSSVIEQAEEGVVEVVVRGMTCSS